MHSRNSFIHTVITLDSSPDYFRVQMWNSELADIPTSMKIELETA